MAVDVSFEVTGLSCAGCVRRAENALSGAAGVTSAQVNLATKRGKVEAEDAEALRKAAQALDSAGYPAAVETLRLEITGLHCAGCVRRAETALDAVPGVISASMSLASHSAVIRVLAGSLSAKAAAKALTEAGYPAEPKGTSTPQDRAAKEQAEADGLRRQVITAAALTLPVFILEMGGHLFPAWHHLIARNIGLQTSWWLQMILTALVLAWPGRVFFAKGVPSLLRRAPEMNSLVALGTAAAFLYSMVTVLAPGLLPEEARAVYFESAGVIVSLILLGRWLEARAKGRTGAAIQRLIGQQAVTALVLRGEKTVEIPAEDLIPGDRVLVPAGARLPADGVIESGASALDESMLTGEPIPAPRGPGEDVTGGSINGSGALTVQVTRVGEDTALAQIIRMVEDAQGAKLPVQSLVDQVTAWFVPGVMLTALTTVILWLIFGPAPALPHALVAGVSVLIISCPCAMGLAVPTSIITGTGRAAELGVFFRKGDALQRLAQVKTAAFDKTGTLTEGKPRLVDSLDFAATAHEALAAAAALEAQSSHPLGRAILAAADMRGLTVPNTQEVSETPGRGMIGQINGENWLIGNAPFLEENGISTSQATDALEQMASIGQTPLLMGRNGALAAVFGLSDPMKSTTPDALAALKSQGLGLAMITGDRQATAQTVADRLGLDIVRAEVTPAGKSAEITALQAGGPVLFVGDGINDAPALAQADTGIAVGTGSDVAVETADVLLMGEDLSGVARAIALSRATMRNIKQNLGWAFGYNIALIPVAAGLLVPFGGPQLQPIFAASAMACSSVLVVSNALRLRFFTPGFDRAAKPSLVKTAETSLNPAE